MLYKPPNPAPEPYASAALWLLYQVALVIRNEASSITEKQLSDLGEAIHNIPESLTEYGHYFDEQEIRKFLAVYDAKWAQSPAQSSPDFSLIRVLDQGIERASEWRGRA